MASCLFWHGQIMSLVFSQNRPCTCRSLLELSESSYHARAGHEYRLPLVFLASKNFLVSNHFHTRPDKVQKQVCC